MLRRRARSFIDAHLGSERLDSDAICNALGVSRRTLYRLFDKEGGVQHYIQARRLERIRSRLTDANETRRISEVAAEFGFVRSDHFARAACARRPCWFRSPAPTPLSGPCWCPDARVSPPGLSPCCRTTKGGKIDNADYLAEISAMQTICFARIKICKGSLQTG
ncbi:MAG: helix-turn-helix domain-containing protein [Candidatus Kaistia colombiensis]|nr:MAG: helix-turn-helix domain-containing protein [Kaistia sp.]